MMFDETISLSGTRTGGVAFHASFPCCLVDDGFAQEFEGIDGAAHGLREMTAFVKKCDWVTTNAPQIGDSVSILGDRRAFRVLAVNDIAGRMHTIRMRQC